MKLFKKLNVRPFEEMDNDRLILYKLNIQSSLF